MGINLMSRYPAAVAKVKKAIPAKVKKGVREFGSAVKTVGELGVAIATEPFTHRILNENTALIDQGQKQKSANAQEAKAITKRYPSKK